MPKDNVNNYLHLHLIVFIWGFTAVLGALISIEALPLVWWRMSIAVGIIVLYMLYRKTKIGIASKKHLLLLAFSGLIIALHWLTFFMAIKLTTVSVTLACLSTGAFFTSFLEPLLYRRKIIGYEVLFGVFVIIGLYIIFNVQTDYKWGILLALVSAFLSALFSVITSRFAKEYNPVTISFYQLLSGVVFLSLYLVVTEQFTAQFFSLSLADWKWLFVLASVCTAYAFIASVKVMKYLSAYTVMLTINLEPVYGIILALLVFKEKEQMTTSFYIGAILILLTILANGIIKNRQSKRKKSNKH